jgi:hypothetical protein
VREVKKSGWRSVVLHQCKPLDAICQTGRVIDIVVRASLKNIQKYYFSIAQRAFRESVPSRGSLEGRG